MISLALIPHRGPDGVLRPTWQARLFDGFGSIRATGYGPDQREAIAAMWVQARARGITPPADWTDPTDRPDLHRDPSWTREAP